MAGLQKAKKYDWKDTNLALFGSDTEKNVKKESAKTEKAWKGAGLKPGLKIWRIVQFKVTDWPEEEYGSFYSGDSYIILNTYKDKNSQSDELLYDVHFWIGKYSTQDEYGTAAYKTVELDTLLDDKPIQHREVQGHESALFKSYFQNITALKGGAATGFRRVKPVEYKPRLIHITGNKKKVTATEVPLKRGNLKDDDIFVIDLGLKIYLWIGVDANKDERYWAAQYVQKMRSVRGGKPETETLDDQTVKNLPQDIADVLREGSSKPKDKCDGANVKYLFRLSDASGSMHFQEVASGDAVKKSLLNSDDVFILDTGDHCYVWTGSGASIEERRNALTYAHNYLAKSKNPMLPITCYSEGQEKDDFHKAF